MDTLSISSLKIMTHIGIHDWEKKILQPLLLDINIPLDCAQVHDQLDNTIDYSLLCTEVSNFMTGKEFNLIETVAEEVAQLILEKFTVTSIKLSVSKPTAVPSASNITVTINRCRTS